MVISVWEGGWWAKGKQNKSVNSTLVTDVSRLHSTRKTKEDFTEEPWLERKSRG